MSRCKREGGEGDFLFWGVELDAAVLCRSRGECFGEESDGWDDISTWRWGEHASERDFVLPDLRHTLVQLPFVIGCTYIIVISWLSFHHFGP